MIATVLLTAALILAPVESNINDGSDGWMDYPNVVHKGEKHLPATLLTVRTNVQIPTIFFTFQTAKRTHFFI